MKQGSFRAICLIFMACIAVLSAFGDTQTPVFESKVLETFSDVDGVNNGVNDDGNRHESPHYEWRLVASKFATKIMEDPQDPESEVKEKFPKLTYAPAYPTAYFRNQEEKPTSLGIWGRFDRRGYNWIDMYPVTADEEDTEEVPNEAVPSNAVPIPIPGRLQAIDMWVWGSNFKYDLEAYFRDYRGMIHVVKMGSINHTGWKNLRATIPASIPQTKVNLPNLAELEFVKFRLWTAPAERVDNFYVYFNQLKILTDMHETPFDGDELADPKKIQEFWNGGE